MELREMDNRNEKHEIRVLRKEIYSDTKSLAVMDEFDGVGPNNKERYDRLVLWREWRSYEVVIERGKAENPAGEITFTKYKKGEDSVLRDFISSQATREELRKYVNKEEVFYFSKPFLFRAQNSLNRSGYGWNWDWSDQDNPIVMEGTLYGETNDYLIVGIYVH